MPSEPNYRVLPLPEGRSAARAKHFAEARDASWAPRVESLYTSDFSRLHDNLPEERRAYWRPQIDGIDCRRTTCIAKIRTNGFSQWLGYFEQGVLEDGDIDLAKFKFTMKCTPHAVFHEVEGDVPSEIPGYTAEILFNCAQPLYAEVPAPPNPAEDRLLNPELHSQLPEEMQQQLPKLVEEAQARYDKERAAYLAYLRRRQDPNFVRLEPQ
jgi:hypothetical protein